MASRKSGRTQSQQQRRDPEAAPIQPHPFYLLAHHLLDLLREYKKSIGPILVILCLFLSIPLKDVIQLLVNAPPENTLAIGQALSGILEQIFGRKAWLVAAVLFGTNLVTAFALCLSLRNNRRNILVLGNQRKEIERDDPGGRTSSGLDEYGDRP